MQKGDTLKTHADIIKITKTNYYPKYSIEKGVMNYLKWFKKYYK